MNTFVKSFVYPFIISLIIFSFIAYAYVPPTLDMIFSEKEDDLNDGSGNEEGEDSDGDSLINASAEGSLTMLLIGTDEIAYDNDQISPPSDTALPQSPEDTIKDQYNDLIDKQKPKPSRSVEFMTLVSFDSSTDTVIISSVPTEAYVTVNGYKTDMNSAYYYIENSMYKLDYGYFADYVTAITGCYVDFYAYIDIDDYVKIADDLGNIPVTLNESASKFDEQGNVIYSYAAGAQGIGKDELYNIIKHQGFSNVFTKTNVLNSVSRYVLEKTATTGYYMNIESKFAKAESSFYQSNVNYEAFASKAPIYFSYIFYIPTPLNVIGDLTTSNNVTVFTVNVTSTVKLFKQ